MSAVSQVLSALKNQKAKAADLGQYVLSPSPSQDKEYAENGHMRIDCNSVFFDQVGDRVRSVAGYHQQTRGGLNGT